MSPTANAKRKAISPPPLKRQRSPLPPKPFDISPALRPVQPLRPDHVRIFAWNINGIAPFLQPSIKTFFSATETACSANASSTPEPASLHACLKRWHFPQILCLQEVHISPSDAATQRAVQISVKRDSKTEGYVAHFSLPHDKYNAKGLRGQRKVHGVCTLVRSDLDSRCITSRPEWDLEGRVLVSRLAHLNLAVVNIYAPNGTSLPYYSPATGAESGTRHDFKRSFHSSLVSLVSHHEKSDGHPTVVIAADMNIARHAVDGFPNHRQGVDHVASRRDFEAKFMDRETGLGMRDTFREVWGQERKFSYRPRNVEWGLSGDRVDLILMSREELEDGGRGGEGEAERGGSGGERRRKVGLVEADALDDEGERGPSDHVPIYVTLDVSKSMTDSSISTLQSQV